MTYEQHLLKRVAEFFKMPEEIISGTSRVASIAHARHTYWFMLSKRIAPADIAKLTGRARSSINHGIDVISGLMIHSERVRQEIKVLTAQPGLALYQPALQFLTAEQQPKPFKHNGREYNTGDYVILGERSVAVPKETFEHLFSKAQQ